MLKEQFQSVLAEFSEIIKTPLALDEDGTATLAIDDEIIANIVYLASSDTIVLFAPVGSLELDSPLAGEKALELLRLNEPGSPACGFTLALDEAAALVVAQDRRLAEEIPTADSLAAWLEALVGAVRAVRAIFAEKFPVEEL